MRRRRGSDPSTESEERNIWKRDRRGIEIRRRGRILKQRRRDKEQAPKAGIMFWGNVPPNLTYFLHLYPNKHLIMNVEC